MSASFRLVIFMGLGMFLSACSKDNDAPKNEEPPKINPVYELIDMKYELADGEGIDTTTLKLTGHEVSNHGNVPSRQKVNMNSDELVKKSLFEIDASKGLPEGLLLDTFKVKVPADWHNDDSYSLNPTVFPLTAKTQEEPYELSGEDVITVQVPPGSRIVISSQIDVYNLKCSFRAVFKDQITGKQDTVSGKWNGTLRYNNSSITLKEHPL